MMDLASEIFLILGIVIDLIFGALGFTWLKEMHEEKRIFAFAVIAILYAWIWVDLIIMMWEVRS